MRSISPIKPDQALVKGFSLIEVMLAIAILSVGMLGMLMLMIKSTQLTTSSNYRATASQLAYMVAESMRGTPMHLASYDNPDATGHADCFTVAGCGSQATAVLETEYQLWQARLAAALPGGVGIVCRDVSAGDATITAAGVPTWNCNAGADSIYVIKTCWSPARESIATVPTCMEIGL